MDANHVIQIIGLVANVFIIPIFGLVWGLHGRISKLEGHLGAAK